MNWIKRIWYAREIKEEKQYKVRQQLEEEYKKEHNQKLQKWEDEDWDRDIEYRAQEMIREYKAGKKEWDIKYRGKELPKWLQYNPIVIAPLPQKLVYMIYNQNTVKYRDTSTIEKAVDARFNELLKEQESKPTDK